MCVRLRETMPELAHDCQFSGGDTTTSYSLSSNGPVSSSGFWSKHRDDVSCNQLQKFWSDLSPQARQKLFRVDKQTLFEQARKNMYCSRCNGLLLEGFLQIVMYGKSLQQEGITGQVPDNGRRISNSRTVEDECDDDIQDPAVHPWGGLTTTRDGTLTLLDCYLYSKSLKGLQNVFGSARARERERELLYPDACGGGGRGWISQGMVGYGRGHGTRETCALHTARLSVDTLVDFWSALGEETHHSLLKMKEEDFMERLMYSFDSKRFCRDCSKNVIREFKELKELKRMRKEPRCTTWFCAAETSFQYEVTRDAIQADWQQTYADSAGTYHHYEWGVGTAQGKSDILEFENVGLNSRVQANGLDLGGLNACYITLRAWKKDGRCNELCVKTHALKGKQCVHCRLIVGDGFVTITRGENIRRFFEHAEEAEEEEDDDSMENEGSEVDGECLRPQKHAKSPELAREFLLDAATVIFKEQVEKAFREGTARQNAHSIFVSLALKLLEQRLLVACKDIITLEKQFKLLEEEEKEKREEEERKERRRAKEKEKKLRRKERLRNKEKESQPNQVIPVSTPHDQEQDLSDLTTSTDDVSNPSDTCKAEDNILSTPTSEPEDDQNLNYKHPRRKSKFWDQSLDWSDRGRFESKPDGGNRLTRSNNPRRLHSSHNRTNDGFDPHGYQNDYSYTRPKTNFQSVKKTWEPMETQKRYTYTPPTFNEPEIDTTNDSKECDSKNTEISNSNSDTCSSEGDGNTSFSFNTQNPESSFTSDSEDSKTKESPSKTPQFCENKINGITDSRNSIPEVHFPVFQPPSVGYYHQAPIGLMPMPLPNYYLFPTPFGYNMNTNGNPHFLQYHPPLTPPLVNQPIPQANGGQNGKSEKTRNTGFSLFHFGGPGDVSSGSVEIDKTLSAHACGKDAVEAEEYNLFATSNGIRFSF